MSETQQTAPASYTEGALMRKSKEDLRAIAREDFDLVYSDQELEETPKKDMVAFLLQLQEQKAHKAREDAQLAAGREEDAYALGGQADAEAEATPAVGKGRAEEEQRVRVIFHETAAPDGADDVPIGVNGRTYQIKRGYEVDVPRAVLHAADLCVMTLYEPDGENPGIARVRNVPRFTYTVIADPAPAHPPRSEKVM